MCGMILSLQRKIGMVNKSMGQLTLLTCTKHEPLKAFVDVPMIRKIAHFLEQNMPGLASLFSK